MQRWTGRIAWVLLAISVVAGGLIAAPDAKEHVIAAGSGSDQLGRDPEAEEESPIRGPVAMVAGTDGLIVLDAVNSRLSRVDTAGKVAALAALPVGDYDDLALDHAGQVWTIDSASRTVYRFDGKQVTPAFNIVDAPGQPEQFDHYVFVSDRLVIGDFASSNLYFYDTAGRLHGTAPWPTALSLIGTKDGHVAFLTMSGGDRYDRLQMVDAQGKMVKDLAVKAEKIAAVIDSGRLLGQLADGRFVGFGWTSGEQIGCTIFTIDATGQAEPLASFDGAPLFAARYAAVIGKTLWLNATLHGSDKVVLRAYDIP